MLNVKLVVHHVTSRLYKVNDIGITTFCVTERNYTQNNG